MRWLIQMTKGWNILHSNNLWLALSIVILGLIMALLWYAVKSAAVSTHLVRCEEGIVLLHLAPRHGYLLAGEIINSPKATEPQVRICARKLNTWEELWAVTVQGEEFGDDHGISDDEKYAVVEILFRHPSNSRWASRVVVIDLRQGRAIWEWPKDAPFQVGTPQFVDDATVYCTIMELGNRLFEIIDRTIYKLDLREQKATVWLRKGDIPILGKPSRLCGYLSQTKELLLVTEDALLAVSIDNPKRHRLLLDNVPTLQAHSIPNVAMERTRGLMALAGGQLHLLADPPDYKQRTVLNAAKTSNMVVSWSPDGRYLATLSIAPVGLPATIRVLDTQGRLLREFSSKPLPQPTVLFWLPDSKHIAVSTHAAFKSYWGGLCIWNLNLEGGK